MTEFKVGDHVKVELDGVVTAVDAGAHRMLVTDDVSGTWVLKDNATKVEPKLPTEPFSVVEFNYTAGKSRHRAVLVGTRWYNMSDARVVPAEMHDIRIVRVGV